MIKKIRWVLLFAAGFLYASVLEAQVTVTGRVTNKKNQPIQGASVIIDKSGQRSGTQTDADGKFQITAPTGSKLIVSYIGYRNEVVNTASGTSNIEVALEE